ncbi:MAG: serine kinase [Bacteroidales bacterium]|nr:serine kinase [Bacteroidales bacterium]
MKVSDIIDKLGLIVYSGQEGLNNDIQGGYVSDLLSDVMGRAKEKQVWVTLQTHKNVMAIASLKDLAAVILINGMKPDDDTILQSNIEGLPLLGTKDTAFNISGKLFNLLKNNEII